MKELRLITLVAALLLALPLQAQNTRSQEARKTRLEKEIALLDKQLGDNESRSRSALGSLTLVQKKVSMRRELLSRSEEQVRALLAVYSAYYSAHSAVDTAPYPGICETLAALREKGVLLCVLSNKDDGDTRALTAHYFGEGLFSLVCGRREGRPRKPAPDVPLEMARELGVPPEQILFIGDSRFDILTGKNAGMGTCGVLWGFRDRAELEAEGADSIVAAPEELIALF